jgi:type I pantothenate kinase
MERKGFPESYDGTALIRFLSEIKAGKPVSEPETTPYGCSIKY